MPALSHVFHLTPDDIWAMTQAEYRAYRRGLDEYIDANKAG